MIRNGTMHIQAVESRGKSVRVRLSLNGHEPREMEVAACGVDGDGFYLELNREQRKDWQSWMDRFD